MRDGMKLSRGMSLGRPLGMSTGALALMMGVTSVHAAESTGVIDEIIVTGVPEWSASLIADYSFTAFGGREAHIGGGWRYVDDRFTEVVRASGNLAYPLRSYDVVDLNAEVQFDPMTVRLFLKNLTDERAFVGGLTTVDAANEPVRFDFAVLQPRTVGVSVDFQF